ncbi:MAG: thiamine pyrophosphate-binding protein, partial [Bdellovibrionota bacterium]
DNVMKVSDVVADILGLRALSPVFIVPGESNVHLLDSVGRHDELEYVCTQEERSASMAVEAFANTKNDLGVLIVSSGGAAAGAIPGVANAWVDSIPLLVISGQAYSCTPADDGMRQVGNKSLKITELVKPITKYCVKVTDPTTIRFHIEKAIFLARDGRPGPVWIDLPVDVQGMTVDLDHIPSFVPNESDHASAGFLAGDQLDRKVAEIVALLKTAKRPMIVAGKIIRSSLAEPELRQLMELLPDVPFVTGWHSADLIPDDRSNFVGRPGSYGQRHANFAVQNCDLLISIGSRLSIPLVGRNSKAFARFAKKVVVDIDPAELRKSTVHFDYAILADARDFLVTFNRKIAAEKWSFPNWLDKCQYWKAKYPSDQYWNSSEGRSFVPETEGIYPLPFVRALSGYLRPETILVADGGHSTNYVRQAFAFKNGQRWVNSSGLSLPGYAISGAVGATIANRRQPVVCIAEERGLLLNIHELQTILEYKLPAKIFVFKSRGHAVVRGIQAHYFGARFVGTDKELQIGAAPLERIIQAYGFGMIKLEKWADIETTIPKILDTAGSVVCEVAVENDHELMPRQGFYIDPDGNWVARPLEDMYPYLGRSQLEQEMLIEARENTYLDSSDDLSTETYRRV